MEKSERNLEIYRMATQNASYDEIAERFGVSRQMVQVILSRFGYKRRTFKKNQKNVTAEDVFQYIVEYKKQWGGHGPFPVEIARQFDIAAGKTERFLYELKEMGLIQVFDDGIKRKVIVVGATWSYDGDIEKIFKNESVG